MTIKHKNENVFKFKKFSERISEVDVRSLALYKVDHINEIPDGNQSYFYQCHQKWLTLNLSEEFALFGVSLRGVNTITLPQVIHHQEKVKQALLDGLDKSTILSLQPLLELVVALAKDLREDFYVYFEQFFSRLVKLLQTQDAEQTEWTLVCLAHLFKVLKPFLCRDIAVVVQQIIPLLSEKNQPEHIINFAVECFAFLVKNLRDKNAFLLTILKTVRKDDSSTLGCGKLFFEMIKGLNGQFHSKGEEFLGILLGAFQKNEFKKYWDVLNEIMVQTVGSIFDYIEQKFISSYWNVLHKAFEKTLNDESRDVEDKMENIQYLLHFLGQSIEYYAGKKVIEVSRIINLVLQVIDCDFSIDIMMTLSKIGALLLLSKNFSLDQLDASRLSKKILHINHADVFESFVINSIDYSQFDILIMPDFLKYFERNFSKKTLSILARIIRRRASKIPLSSERSLDYNINLKNRKTVDEIVSKVTEFKLNSSPEDLEEFINSIHILPCLISFDKNRVENSLKILIGRITKELKAEGNLKSLYILALTLSSLHDINEKSDKLQTTEIIGTILPLTTDVAMNFLSMKILNFLINSLDKSCRDKKLFEKIHSKLRENLISPHQQIRLLTLQILAKFDHLNEAQMFDSDDESIFTNLMKIEEISSTIQTYREQVLLLQKIEYDSTYFQSIRNTQYVEDSVKFCLGFLNTKMQLLFEPTKNVLESYINGLDVDYFWNIYKQQLITSIDQQIEDVDLDGNLTDNDFINEDFLAFAVLKDKSYDPILYRVRLWQVLSETKTIIHDRKHKDIVEMFMNFLHNEFEHEDDDDAPKARQKLLISHLQVLKNLNNPKCVYKTVELRTIYFKFLIHRNFYVQKIALDCILQYKDEALINYKELLHNILDEKSFRAEITKFNLNADIKEFHRDEFVKILLPILYSKLTIKSSKKDQDAFRNRKEVIIRFMSNLKENEIEFLMKTVLEKISNVMSANDAAKINVRVNELQSMHEFLDMVLKNIAGLFSVEFQKRTLENLLAISCFCVSTTETTTTTTIHKNLKQSCLNSLVYFFEHFDEFQWNDDAIDLIFELFIWMNLEHFHQHSSQNISALMRLFIEWSKNPKYYIFLQKQDSIGNFSIKSIVQLLSNKSASHEVVECVLDIIERLLTLKSDDEEILNDLNYGTKIIQPFLNDILVKLKDTLSSKKWKSLNQRNLLILSRVTELVTDVESSMLLLDILFPLTLKKTSEKSQDDEGIIKLLSTILNLIKVVDNPISYIRQLSPLFEHIYDVNQRKLLMKIFNGTVTDDRSSMKLMINDLNAYDRRWIEQPDYEKRLSVFHQIEKMLNEEEISVDFAVIFIFHCFYFLKYDNDMAVKDNSGHFLKLVCCKVIQQFENDKQVLDYFLSKTVLNLIQKRIRDVEKVRTEALNLLGELARKHPTAHPILTDLHPLTNSANIDLDFFENITHLQKFRHMKALRKFTEVSTKLGKAPGLQTLVEFLLPISRIFLCSVEYKKKSKVVEAAIEFVAAISKFLPWSSYEKLLIFYVRKMRADAGYQKQFVKLIPAIMDSFHFELNEIEKVDEKENLDEIEDDMDVENEVEAEIDEHETIPAANLSHRVARSLTRRLVPSLTRIITDISTETHKLNKQERRVKEKASMVKIPIALSIVKLLKKLPSKYLDENLSQIVLKVAAFLKSTLKQVRGTARHTLKEILITVGPSYLGHVIGNLKSVLVRGFQVHVLSVTVFTLMDAMKTQLMETEDANKVLEAVLKICIDDIFGNNAEEVELSKMSRKAPEVKPSRKSFDTLNILAATISENYVFEILLPFKNILQETQSKKSVLKVQECLLKIVNGLTSNPKVSQESLMVLTHGTISESIPDLLPQEKKKEVKSKVVVNDCFIIAEEPKRRGASVINKAVKSCKQTNSYVLVEFGFELLHLILKKKKIPDESYLNPLVPMLCNSIKSSFLKVNLLAVKCLTIMWHHRLDVTNLRDNVGAIVADVFGILHKYATNQISKKDNNFLLVRSCFKCVIAVMKQVDYYTINDNQLKALLLYVEQELQSMEKDNMAFVLLRSILDKKLMVPELHEIMKKVADISITSEIDEKRATIRPIVLTYLMEYPLGKKLESLVKFFIAQLNYEEISGRESAILMMALMMKHFPIAMLRKFSGLFFLSLGTRLVNDDSPNCREKIADAIETLIKQLDNNPREQLFEIVLSLLKDKKLVHREMGAQLSVRFINAENESFKKRIATILPLLIQSIKVDSETKNDDEIPGKFVRVKKMKSEEDDEGFNEDDEKDQQVIMDHHLIQTLNAIIRIFEVNEQVLKDLELKNSIDDIGYQVKDLLAHEHVWVRLKCLKIVNFMIKSLDVGIIEKILLDQPSATAPPREFLYSKKEFRSLAFDMAVQLKSDVDKDLLELIMENLFEITKILKNLPFEGMINDKKDFSLTWMIRRLRYAVHSEVATAPQSIIIRKSVFGFFDSLIDSVDVNVLKKLASPILTTVLREVVEGEHVIEELKQVANLTANKIKTQIGLKDFDKIRLDLQSKMLRKRVDRRKNLAQEKINNPAKAATRTIHKQLKKQDNKKRKRLLLQDGMVLPKKKKRMFVKDNNSGMNDE